MYVPSLNDVRLRPAGDADEHLHQEHGRWVVRILARMGRRRASATDCRRVAPAAITLLRLSRGGKSSVGEVLQRSDGGQERSGLQIAIGRMTLEGSDRNSLRHMVARYCVHDLAVELLEAARIQAVDGRERRLDLAVCARRDARSV